MRASRVFLSCLAPLVWLAACGGDPADPVVPPGPDATMPEHPADAGPDATHDTAPDAAPDARLDDASGPDAPAPAPAPDAGTDAATPDAAMVDAAPPDALPPDATPPAPDAALPDASPPLGGFVITTADQQVAPNDFRYWLVRVPLDGGPAVSLTSPTGPYISGFEVTPDGSFVVYQQGGALFSLRTDGSSPPLLLAGPYTSGAIFTLSPRGDRVAYTEFSDKPLFTVRLDGTGLVDVSGGRQAERPLWSPRGDLLVYEHTELPVIGALMLTCADHDCSQPLLTGKHASPLGFSPDGAYLAADTYNSSVQELWTIDMASLASHRLAPAIYNLSGSLRWSPDGRRLTFLTGTTDAETLHVGCADGTCTSTLALPFIGSVRVDDSLGWSSDGSHVIAAAQTANGRPLRLFTLCSDGTCVHEYPVAGDNGYAAGAFSPEGFVVHRGRLPGSSTIEIVADCLDEACPRVSATQGSDAHYGPPRWHPGTNRFAVSAGLAGVLVSEGIGSIARHLFPGGSLFENVSFDVSGQRVLFQDARGHVRSIRIDGSDLRDLSATVTPASGRLSSFRMVVR